MKTQKNLFLFFLILVFIPFIYSQGASDKSTAIQGCEIEAPIVDTLVVNSDYDFNIHVFNTSNGVPLSNTSQALFCVIHLYNSSGDHTLDMIATNDPVQDHRVKNEFVARIKGGNFSLIEEYRIVAQCNATTYGCYFQETIQVVPSTLTDSLGFFIMLSIIIIGFLLFSITIKNIPATMIAGLINIAWGLFIILNGFYIYRNGATQLLSILIIANGIFWSIKAGLESIDS
jgi:hypothetical protein